MRLWSIHPQYLDRAGLTAVWREALLAQAVLAGHTTGYRHHPQLQRFRATRAPLDYLNTYLAGIWQEAEQRGYHFQITKIGARPPHLPPLHVSTDQLSYEFQHLMRKLQTRNEALYHQLQHLKTIQPHPLFTVVPGPVAAWEKVQIY